MASIVIVTNQCYLIAKQIHYITVRRHDTNIDYRRQGQGGWTLEIAFSPADGTPNPNGNKSYGSGSDMVNVAISVTTAELANKLHAGIVQQIRKQMPDQLFLDEAIDKLLSGEKLTDEQPIRSTKKVRRTRKAKRSRKKVLRRP